MRRKRFRFALLVAVTLAGSRAFPVSAQAPVKKITYEQAYGTGMREGGFFRLGEASNRHAVDFWFKNLLGRSNG